MLIYIYIYVESLVFLLNRLNNLQMKTLFISIEFLKRTDKLKVSKRTFLLLHNILAFLAA